MSRKAITLIEIEGGRQIGRFTHLAIEQHVFGHHEFHLQLPIEVIEGDGNYTFTESKGLIGKQITIALESDMIADTQSPPFKGVITDISLIRSYTSSNDVLISGKSNTLLMDSDINYRSFEKMTWSDVVEDTMKSYPPNMISFTCKPTHSAEIPYLVQYKESDFHFLQRTANRLGEWCFYDGSEMQLGQPEWEEPISLLLSRDLFEFQLGVKLQPTSYKTFFYDYTQSKVYKSTSTDHESNHIDKVYGQSAFDESRRIFKSNPAKPWMTPLATQTELDDQVKIQIDQQASNMVYMHASSEHIALGIGKVVSISANKSEDDLAGIEEFGEFIIISIKHYIGGDGDYHNDFQAIPKDASIPPVNPDIKMPKARPEPAIVKDNHDPDSLGRIRVQFYWQSSKDMSPWIRQLSSSGGASGGFFVIPEKGDEVMVDYEYYHPDRPFVMGSVYNKEGKPSGSWSEKDNNIKAIKTKSGNEIILMDKGGKECIKILNKGGEHSIILTMEAGGSISISTSNQLNLSGKNISIHAEETIAMNAKNLTVNTTEDTNIKATGNIITNSDMITSISAKQAAIVQSTEAAAGIIAKTDVTIMASTGNVTVNADVDAAVSSNKGNVVLQGKVNVDLVAEAQVNVSGKAMTNVSSDGPVIVSGALVQLN